MKLGDINPSNNWKRCELAVQKINGVPGIDQGFLRRAVMEYVEDKGTSATAAEVNELAELKAVSYWYWKADEVQHLARGYHEHRLIQEAVKYSLTSWSKELDDLTEKKNRGDTMLKSCIASDTENSDEGGDSDYTTEEAINGKLI